MEKKYKVLLLKVKTLSAYETKSVVGIGIIYLKSQVFFTLNGKVLETINF
jgi:hypothetical protein